MGANRTPEVEASPRRLALQGKVMEKNGVIENLETQLSNLNSRFEMLEEELIEVQEKRDESEKHLKMLEKEKKMVEDENGKLIQEGNQPKETLGSLTKAAEEIKKNYSDTEEVMSTFNEQIQDLKKANQDLELKLSQSEEARNELVPLLKIKDKFEEAMAQIAGLENLEHEFLAKESKWQTEMEQAEQSFEQLENDVRLLSEQLEV